MLVLLAKGIVSAWTLCIGSIRWPGSVKVANAVSSVRADYMSPESTTDKTKSASIVSWGDQSKQKPVAAEEDEEEEAYPDDSGNELERIAGMSLLAA